MVCVALLVLEFLGEWRCLPRTFAIESDVAMNRTTLDGARPLNNNAFRDALLVTKRLGLQTVTLTLLLTACGGGEDISFEPPGQDRCALEPGPDCCDFARDGQCDEPEFCIFGTDTSDCRGGLVEPVECDDETPVLGLPDEQDVERFEFVWSDVFNDISVTERSLSFRLADDVAAVSVTVLDGDAPTGLAWRLDDLDLLAGGGDVAGSGVIPYNAASEPRAGCLNIWPYALGGEAGVGAELAIVTRRFVPQQPSLDVNVILVGDVELSSEDLNAALSQASDIYTSNGGPTLEVLDVVELDTASVIPAEGDAINALRATEVGDDPISLNLFFIADFTPSDGTLGIAGGIPGPNGVPETPSSGLVVAVEPHLAEDDSGAFTLDVPLMASTIAHELGHQLGLFHTTEDDGFSASPIEDHGVCEIAAGAEEALPEDCVDGRNLMFWVSGDEPQETLSRTQVQVLNGSPIVY